MENNYKLILQTRQSALILNIDIYINDTKINRKQLCCLFQLVQTRCLLVPIFKLYMPRVYIMFSFKLCSYEVQRIQKTIREIGCSQFLKPANINILPQLTHLILLLPLEAASILSQTFHLCSHIHTFPYTI